MAEHAVNLPLSGGEIREIVLGRLEQRISQNSYLSDPSAYAGFEFKATIEFKLHGMSNGKTLVWDEGKGGDITAGDEVTMTTVAEQHVSEAPNIERQHHELPMTVEVTDGKGKKSFKKARVKA